MDATITESNTRKEPRCIWIIRSVERICGLRAVKERVYLAELDRTVEA